tara:strand:+ start:11401 stop:11736 length:336 start_codon:yes stop_codon:yes gene_type:complete
MPVFTGYSHENKESLDKLAMQLVQQNVHIWLDHWELSLGDSITDKVQGAANGASAYYLFYQRLPLLQNGVNESSVSIHCSNKKLNARRNHQVYGVMCPIAPQNLIPKIILI